MHRDFKIGKHIQNLRLEHDLSLRDLADKIGVADSTLCRMENDKCSVSVITACKLAKLYGVTVDYLIGLTDKKEKIPAPAATECEGNE